MTTNPRSSIIVIPARMASERYPGKPLVQVGKYPLLLRTYLRAKEVGADNVIVTSPDKVIAQYCKFDEIPFYPSHIDLPTGTARVAEIANTMKKEFDVYVNWQVDEPTVDPTDVRTFIEELPTQSIGTLYQTPLDPEEFAANPHRVKIRSGVDSRAWDFTRAPLPLADEHVGVYLFRSRDALRWAGARRSVLSEHEGLEQLAWIDQFDILLKRTSGALSINVPEDLPSLEAYYNDQEH